MIFCFFWFFFVLGIILMLAGFYFMDYNSLVYEFSLSLGVFYDLSFSFLVDYVSLFFFSTVSLISSMVFIYSKYYMSIKENEFSDCMRFISILFLFVVSMFFLVFSFSWVTVMLGWDGLGLISFLLVIYYNDSKSLESGLVTVLTNRLGDCLFLLGFCFMFYVGRFSFDYLSFFSVFLFVVFILLGCITKSAQMPFSSWLPAAMAAPTPVSSLVHSSTLVTAGVFLLIRFNYLFLEGYFILSLISLFTMTIAGLFANYEFDFKKVVAMSTLSQLGFMIFSISLGNWLMGFFHVIFHAFFKSSLFLSTGSLMHFIFGNQDSRFFGNFFMSFFSKLFFSMSCLSLMGFPFSLGFYSKDVILGYSIFYFGGLVVVFFCLSCCFTVAYSLRLLDMGFLKFSYFDSFIVFGEDKKFFLCVSLLFFFNVFMGNFFMFYFIPLELFSFLDLSLGILIILVGFLFFKFSVFGYSISFLMSSMLSLPYLVSKFSSKSYNFIFVGDDLTWNEVATSVGVNNFIKSVSNFLSIIFNLKSFFVGFVFFSFLIFNVF